MHIHILGICGTFMGGLAALARELGHEVTGADRAAWPPMSTHLRELGIEPVTGFDPGQLDARPDLVLVGNVMSRGMPIVEALLDSGLEYLSGPEWLGSQVLPGREVIAVTGTHGKTTTSGMVAWLLQDAGLEPGFLIGGAPGNFDRTARLGSGRHFVIEGDEYDTAFFDKNAKFLHYRARTVIINNIEHDHADIYADLEAVMRQFHLLLRRTPPGGRLIVNGADANIAKLLEKGCWTPVERFSVGRSANADWRAERVDGARGSGSRALRAKPKASLNFPDRTTSPMRLPRLPPRMARGSIWNAPAQRLAVSSRRPGAFSSSGVTAPVRTSRSTTISPTTPRQSASRLRP